MNALPCAGASKCGSHLPTGRAGRQSCSSERAIHAGEPAAHCSPLRATGCCQAPPSMQPAHFVPHKGDRPCRTSVSIVCLQTVPFKAPQALSRCLCEHTKHWRADAPVCVQDGSTPLHYAAAFGQTGVIRTLMQSGCHVDATDDAKNTPLHLAAGEPAPIVVLLSLMCWKPVAVSW